MKALFLSITLMLISVACSACSASTITASHPVANANVTAPFLVEGGGTHCAGGEITSTGYSIDEGATVISKVNPFSYPVNASLGSHIAHIKCWGRNGQHDSVAVPFTVVLPTPPTTPAPTFSEPGGDFTASQSVSLTDTTFGATIHFTVDGSVPTVNSPVYTTPIIILKPETIEAVAWVSGHSLSPVSKAVYNVVIPPPPAHLFEQIDGD